jgi:ABC-type branched-subunit amino acid transport system substrate-binding protein
MEAAGSSSPRAVANHLRSEVHRSSLSGPVTFDENGDVVGRSVVMTIVQDGNFAYLAGRPIDVPDTVADMGGQGIESP